MKKEYYISRSKGISIMLRMVNVIIIASVKRLTFAQKSDKKLIAYSLNILLPSDGGEQKINSKTKFSLSLIEKIMIGLCVPVLSV